MDGTRKIDETDSNKEVVVSNESGNGSTITSKVIMPKIEGAIITAEGAKDINIKANIISAVAAVTGLPEYKVQVFEMN
jgi:stage III sporulation protein AG